MASLLVIDVPVTSRFKVQELDGTVLYKWDGKGPGDTPPDVAIREVVNAYVKHKWLILEVK